MKPPAFSPSPPPSDVRRSKAKAGERRARRVAFVVSVAIHAIAIVLYPVLMDRLVLVPPPTVPGDPDDSLRGIEVVLLREVPPDPAATPEEPPEVQPEPEAVPVTPAQPRPVAPTQDPPVRADDQDEEERRATAAERLRPRLGDPRLWMPMDRAYTDLSDEERAELMLRGMIRTWSDSVAVAAALSGRATDWTFTDDQGRRWGLSPGRLHLGDFSIPLPFSFDLPPGRRDEFARRQWELDDLMRGAASAEIRQTWAQRAQEIRERMDEERARNRGGGGER